MDIVERRVLSILADKVRVEHSAIQVETPLESLGDSLDAVLVTMEIEDEFEISVPDDSVCRSTNVGALVAMVRRIIDEQGSAGVGAKRKPPQKPPGEARRDLGDE